MRTLTPKLTPELEGHVDGQKVAASEAYPVQTYKELVEHVSKLSYENREELLFFRGQNGDYKNKEGNTTLYPKIYRG
jgi:hypothetical protein